VIVDIDIEGDLAFRQQDLAVVEDGEVGVRDQAETFGSRVVAPVDRHLPVTCTELRRGVRIGEHLREVFSGIDERGLVRARVQAAEHEAIGLDVARRQHAVAHRAGEVVIGERAWLESAVVAGRRREVACGEQQPARA